MSRATLEGAGVPKSNATSPARKVWPERRLLALVQMQAVGAAESTLLGLSAQGKMLGQCAVPTRHFSGK